MNNIVKLTIAFAMGTIIAMDVTANDAINTTSDDHVEVVDANGVDFIRMKLQCGRLTEITIQGDGDTDLDLYVYDKFGNLVALDEGPTDLAGVRFVPQHCGVYTIKVVNLGSYWNRYRFWIR